MQNYIRCKHFTFVMQLKTNELGLLYVKQKRESTYIISDNNCWGGLFRSFLCTLFTSDRELTDTNVFPTLGSIIVLHEWKRSCEITC